MTVAMDDVEQRVMSGAVCAIATAMDNGMTERGRARVVRALAALYGVTELVEMQVQFVPDGFGGEKLEPVAKITVQQDFRDLDPNRVSAVFADSLERATEDRSSVGEKSNGAERHVDESPPESDRPLPTPEERLLAHTFECIDNAAKTGKPNCIGPCTQLRAGTIDAAEYRAHFGKAPW